MRKFGNVTRVKEDTREVWSFTWFEQFWVDACFGIRALWKHPGFASVAVVRLALGIWANTAIFSVVEGVILAPLPYPQTDRLVLVQESRPNLAHLDISYPDFQDWQRSVRSFEQMAALTWRDYDLTGRSIGASRWHGGHIGLLFYPRRQARPGPRIVPLGRPVTWSARQVSVSTGQFTETTVTYNTQGYPAPGSLQWTTKWVMQQPWQVRLPVYLS